MTRCLLVRPEFPAELFTSKKLLCDVVGAKAAGIPLGLLNVAALLPADWDLALVDGVVRPPADADLRGVDWVMVSSLAPQRHATHDIIRRAHAHGARVIVGGPGPTMFPDAYPGADFVVTGDAEVTLPQLLADLENGAARGTYRASHRSDLHHHLVPRYDLLRLDDYAVVAVQFTRGCPFTCEFCAQIGVDGNRPTAKTPEQILAVLQTLYDLGYRGIIDFGYDNFIGNRSHTVAVLTAMRDWLQRHDHPFCFGTEASINLARDAEILQLMRDTDFRYVFFGIESSDEPVLRRAQKLPNTQVSTVEAAEIFHAHGLVVYGSLILGLDGETGETVDHMIDLIQHSAIFPTLILPLYAFPDTQLHVRLAREGRLFAPQDLEPRDLTEPAITGLNFVTTRPRTEILSDLIRLIRSAYHPDQHAERVLRLASRLVPDHRHRPPLRKRLRSLYGFFRLMLAAKARPWRILWRVLTTNPAALEAAAGQEVLRITYAEQGKHYIRALEKQIAMVEAVGERKYEAERRQLRPASGWPADAPPGAPQQHGWHGK